MRTISGVSVKVWDGNRVLTPDHDGHLGRLRTEHLTIAVVIRPGRNVYGMTVDRNKNVTPQRDLSNDPTRGKLYRLKITIEKAADRDVYYTTYPANNLRLAELLDYDPGACFNDTGAVRLWEIAVISQYGKFFLTVQPWEEVVEAYQDGNGDIYYPTLVEKWPAMSEYLVSLLPDHVDPSPAAWYESPEEAPLNGLAANHGIVQWYNDAQGVGAIRTKQGLARVHWSQLPKRDRRAFLRPGEEVSFAKLRPPKENPLQPTEFKLEAVKVAMA